MTKDKKIVWRLSELPSAGEVAELVEAEVLSKEEAREILLNELDKKDELEKKSEQVKSLEEQIKFQQDLIEKLIQQLGRTHGFWNITHTYTPRYPTTYWLTSAGGTSGTALYTMNVSDNKVIASSSSTGKIS